MNIFSVVSNLVIDRDIIKKYATFPGIKWKYIGIPCRSLLMSICTNGLGLGLWLGLGAKIPLCFFTPHVKS